MPAIDELRDPKVNRCRDCHAPTCSARRDRRQWRGEEMRHQRLRPSLRSPFPPRQCKNPRLLGGGSWL